jgi:hypothetical protein
VPKDKVNVVRTYPARYKNVAVRKVYLQWKNLRMQYYKYLKIKHL